MAARAHPWITDADRSRRPRMVTMVVVVVAMVRAHRDVCFLMVVLVRGL
jgi:hypothetical protein